MSDIFLSYDTNFHFFLNNFPISLSFLYSLLNQLASYHIYSSSLLVVIFPKNILTILHDYACIHNVEENFSLNHKHLRVHHFQ